MKTDYEKFKILGTISALLRQLEEPSTKPELDMFGEPIASPNKTLDVSRVDVKDIKVDPKAYQFRSEVGHDGTDKRLNEVKAWDDLRAGVMVIHERHDGQQFIADGHHRIALAKKLGVDGVNAFVLKESEGHTVDDAKSLAALVNLANNNGTGVDAAKLFRSNANGKRPEQLMEDLNLPKNQAIKTGVALAKLSDDVFGSVVNGVIEERDGAVIGDTFSSPEEQQAALKQFMRVRPANQEESQVLAQQIKLAGFSKAQASDNFDLFGSELDTDSLLGERTRLIVALGRAYKKDKTLFETLGINASKIEQAGNKLDKDTNSKLSNEATVMQSLLGEQIYTNPKMKQVLDQYATELKDNPNGMATILAKLKQALPQVVSNVKPVFDDAGNADFEAFMLIAEATRLLETLSVDSDDFFTQLMRLQAIIAQLEGLNTSTHKSQDSEPDPEERATRGKRQKANNAAIALLQKIDSGEAEVTPEAKAILAKYSGGGGNLVNADGTMGSDYEYYTPKPIAKAMWSLLGELGFSGGKVLDPSAGVGVFGSNAPTNAVVDSIELDHTSGRINQILNSSEKQKIVISPFEEVAAKTPDNLYDVVVTNVPFGDVGSRGANRFKDKRYSDKPLDYYFILRSLEKLKYGGLAAFIVPPRIVSGKEKINNDLRYNASLMAEFVGAYRLPNVVFANANADTITDVVVFRKFAKDSIEQIEALLSQNTDVLRESKVLFDDFLQGDYFKTEGKRFILGEFQAKDPNKYRDVDRVIHHGSMTDIAKLLTKFPDSRINWDLLNTSPTLPIIYREGDTLVHGGQTLQMRAGDWVVKQSDIEQDAEMAVLGSKLATPAVALANAMIYANGKQYHDYLVRLGRFDDVPEWLKDVNTSVLLVAENTRAAYWQAITAGFAVQNAFIRHGELKAEGQEQFNYNATYPFISKALLDNAPIIRSPSSKLDKIAKGALGRAKGVVLKEGLSKLWLGESNTIADLDVQDLTSYQQYEKLMYGTTGQAKFVPVVDMKKVMGDDFDPMTSDDWCLSADGQGVLHADDYFVGNYKAFLDTLESQLDTVTDEAVRTKLLRQKMIADNRVRKTDVEKMSFNLHSPFVDIQTKVEFLQRYINPSFRIEYDGDEPVIAIPESVRKEGERGRNLGRFVEYLKTGRAFTLTSSKDAEDDPEMEKARLKSLMDTIEKAEAQFEVWVKANPKVIAALQAKANNPEILDFIEVEATSSLEIKGFNPKSKSPDFAMHGYQNAAVRKNGRHFGGILGLDVGLGKTLTALASVQYVHSIGAKKKTMVIVPASVLSNWKKEATFAYENLDDCLFVGLRQNKQGKDTVNSSAYDEDLNVVLENRHKKIFLTLEAFAKIPLREKTKSLYLEHLAETDDRFDVYGKDSKKAQERAKGAAAQAVEDIGEKSGAVPFFEDMGIDSLVMDEGHVYKNSRTTNEFKSAKFLASPTISQRGADANIKCWVVRGDNAKGDGVMVLTATPITNSPLEIYNMLSLAVGEKQVNKGMLGIKGVDEFMEAFADISEEESVNIVGEPKLYRTFTGLRNVELLRSMLHSNANIRTAKQENLKIPEADEVKVGVALGDPAERCLRRLSAVYALARDFEKGNLHDEDELKMLMAAQADFNEPIKLLAHPFNLIKKMTDVIIDQDVGMDKATRWTFLIPQAALAQKVVDAFNKTKQNVKQVRLSPLQSEDDILSHTTDKDENGESYDVLKVMIRAVIEKDGVIVLPTTNFDVTGKFLEIAAKMGLEIDTNLSPKVAAMIENFKKENAHSRNGTSKVKQIIFCDLLVMHHKLKVILSQQCGIPADKIAIINGTSIKDPVDMQIIQDGFNANDDENQYQIIIANEKAEVGINLQKGTQAIHHLTIHWTPDSLQQRNGRGVRQGNHVEKVSVYYYDANGTFDEYKRNLVNKKADWISQVMTNGGGNKVQIANGLSNTDYETMIASIGDADALRKAQEEKESKEKDQRAQTSKKTQLQQLNTIDSQKEQLKRLNDTGEQVATLYKKAFDLYAVMRKSRTAANNADASPAFRKRAQARYEQIKVQYDEIAKTIRGSVVFRDWKKDLIDVDSALSVATTRYKTADVWSEKERIKYAFNSVVEGSELDISIATEKKISESMIEQAVKSFADADNGYHPSLADAYNKGEAILIGNMIAEAGTFAYDKQGDLWVLAKRNSFYFVRGVAQKFQARGQELYRFDDYQKSNGGRFGNEFNSFAQLITRHDPDYQQTLIKAAAIDDDLSRKTGFRNPDKKFLLADYNPEVAAYHQVKSRVWYSAKDYTLPFGFPYVADSIKYFDESVLNEIRHDQHVSIDVEGSGQNAQFAFKAGSAFEVDGIEPIRVSEDNPVTLEKTALALIDFASANRLEIKGLLSFLIMNGVGNANKVDYIDLLALRLDGAKLKQQVFAELDKLPSMPNVFKTKKEADDWLVKEVPIMVVANKQTAWCLDVFSLTIFDIAKLLHLELDELYQYVTEEAPVIPEPVAIEPVKQDSGIAALISSQEKWGLVALTDANKPSSKEDSPTYRMKDRIKDISKTLSRKQAGWHGKTASWTITTEVCARLFEGYPDQMKDVAIIAPQYSALK